MLVFHFSIEGEVILPCDRCNEPVHLKVNGKERLVVKFGDTFEEQSDELQIIPESETHFDTAPFLYECIHLLLPMRRIHPEEGLGRNSCNPEILQKLDELTAHHNPDPRWDALKQLKIDNS